MRAKTTALTCYRPFKFDVENAPRDAIFAKQTQSNMRLPSAEKAVVSDEKLLRYILSPVHPHGRTHARLFDRLLGINLTNADRLRDELLKAAQTCDVTALEPIAFGTKYTIHFSLSSARGVYTILSVWMVESDDDIPRLLTAYIE